MRGKRDAFPLQCAVLLETSHIPLDDRFAAQITSRRIGFSPFAPQSHSRGTRTLYQNSPRVEHKILENLDLSESEPS